MSGRKPMRERWRWRAGERWRRQWLARMGASQRQAWPRRQLLPGPGDGASAWRALTRGAFNGHKSGGLVPRFRESDGFRSRDFHRKTEGEEVFSMVFLTFR